MGILLTSVASVHVSDQGRTVGVQVRDHLRVGLHVVDVG